ncbi:MAG: hypothetical protein O3A33_05810 [Chloroflexi bacterium]|nr:hypothetical protein [Chloroflexota bacterium]
MELGMAKRFDRLTANVTGRPVCPELVEGQAGKQPQLLAGADPQ